MGKGFPTIAASNIYFDALEQAQVPGEARGKGFPTIGTP